MAVEYQLVPLKGFGGGQDSYSAPSSIQPPYVAQLLNMDVQASGLVQTRKGYEGYYGYVPLRATQLTHIDTTINIRVGTSSEIDFGLTPPSPILIYGKRSGGDLPGDFASNELIYYPTFTINNKFPMTEGTGTISVTADDHGLTSKNILVGLAEVTGEGTNYTSLLPDSLTIDATDFGLSLEYNTPEATSTYVYWKQVDEDAGSTHIEEVTAQTSVEITAEEHTLDNFNIQVECYDNTSGDNVKVLPDSVTISATGTVTVTFAADFTGDIILHSVQNVATTTAFAGNNTITISNPETPWIFVSAYYWDSDNSVFRQVLVDGIEHNSSTGEININYYLDSGSEAVEIYYTFGNTRGNLISVEDTGEVSATYEDNIPQITIWGIPHSEIYLRNDSKQGHINLIDAYRRLGESRLVCGVGGNVYSAQSRSEAGTTYGMPLLYTNLRIRTNQDLALSPLLHTTGSSSSRTRGIVTDDSISENKARVTAASYVSEGVVDYTLSFTSKTGTISTLSTISTSDYLTVSGMANRQHNGNWKILSVQSDSTTETVIRVTNSSVWGSALDETAAGGRAGVFTDLVTSGSDSYMLAGDGLLSDAISDDLNITVASVSGTNIYVQGVSEDITIPSGQNIFARRTTDVVPLRTVTLASSSTNLVRGDMLSVSGYTRKVRAKYVNSNSDIDITDIDGDGTTATVTTESSHGLTTGRRILIVQASDEDFNGTHTVTSVPDDTTFTFSSESSTTGATGTLVGNTVELDESISVQDSSSDVTFFEVEGRWIPIEVPTHSFDLPDTTLTTPFDVNSFVSQPRVNTTTIADSLFLSNGDDEVFKVDGTNIYRAGLFRWQPQLFAQVDTTTGSITINTTSITTDSTGTVSGNRFKVNYGEEVLVAGRRISDSGDGAIYTVVTTSDDGEYGYVYVDRTISDTTSSSRSLTIVATRTYYFRANAIDSNNSIVASATTGLSDFVVELDTAGQVKMKLLGRPNFGPYDYDRIEVEIYATRQGTSAPFYKVATLADTFDTDSRYIEFTDGTPDELLLDLDRVNTAILGAEVGTGWDQPLRAKYITSTNNSLVTANLKDYPQLDVVLRKKSSAVTLSASDLDGKVFTLRDDNTESGGVEFEFVDGTGAVTIDPSNDLADDGLFFTVSSTAHGLSVGDWVYMYHSAEGKTNHLEYAGWWRLFSVTTDTFTVSRASSGTINDKSNQVNRYIAASDSSRVPVLLGTDGNYNQVGGNTTGSLEFLAPLRLANAINAQQTTSLTPFVTAAAGSLYGVGRLVLRQPEVRDTTMELVVPTLSSSDTFRVYVNNIERESDEQVSAVTRLYPSRVAISFPNYPEIMDSPQAEDPTVTRSAVDINAADGQEITGVISFFGDSSFGDSQKEGVAVVAKSDNIYVLNTRTREYERVDQPYGGNVAGFPMVHTENGVIFGNESGIYRLNRDLTITWVGKYADRVWKRDLNRNSLGVAATHNYKRGKQVRISFPAGSGQNTNNRVLVLDYSAPQKRENGVALGVYDNFPATGWAGLGDESFFGTTDGQIFRIRNADDNTDYRDDDAAFTQTLVIAPEDFDLPGVQKTIDGIFVQFFNDSEAVEGIEVSTALDGKTTFHASDVLDVTDTLREEDGRWFSLHDRRGRKLQVKISNSTKDQFMAIAGMAVRAAAISRRGTKQAVSAN